MKDLFLLICFWLYFQAPTANLKTLCKVSSNNSYITWPEGDDFYHVLISDNQWFPLIFFPSKMLSTSQNIFLELEVQLTLEHHHAGPPICELFSTVNTTVLHNPRLAASTDTEPRMRRHRTYKEATRRHRGILNLTQHWHPNAHSGQGFNCSSSKSLKTQGNEI